jgi:hypothetical protein
MSNVFRAEQVAGIPRREFLIVALVLSLATLLSAGLFWTDPAGGRGVGFSDFPTDDAWIQMVYSRALATTGRPEYNPGVMESGMTSPLWVLVNALAWWPGKVLGLNPTILPKLLSMLSGALCAFLLYLLVRWKSSSPLLAGAAALLLATDSHWAFSLAAGMEAPFFTLLVLLALAGLERENDLLLGIAAGAAPLARPEGAVLSLFFVAFRLATLFRGSAWSPNRTRGGRIVAKLVLPGALSAGGWAAYNLLVTGRPLPNTFYVKAEVPRFLDPAWLLSLGGKVPMYWDFLGWGGLALFAAGSVFLLVRVGGWKRNLPLVLSPWLFIAALSFNLSLDLRYYYWSRYVHPTAPLFILPLFLGLYWGFLLVKSIPWFQAWEREGLWSRRAFPVLVLFVFGVLAWPGLYGFSARADQFSLNCMNIRETDVAAGSWLVANSRPGEWVLAVDAGAIRFFSGRPVLDIEGLNSHAIAHAPAGMERGRALLAQIAEKSPRYAVAYPGAIPDLVRRLRLSRVTTMTTSPYTCCEARQLGTAVIYRFP